MLRSQYGVATSSSVTPMASHAEDAQPNEVIYKRRHGRPPQIGSTWKNNYGDSGIQRGGYRGLWTEYGMRGNSLRRGRGNFQPNREGRNSIQRQRNEDSAISPSAKRHSPTAEPMRPKSIDNKPLLPGRHRRFEGSSAVDAPHPPEPLGQVTTAVSSTVPNILAAISTIKKEQRTPSPGPSRLERTLITSSCKFYPIPEFCKKSCPDFKENRNAFFKEKMQELKRLGLLKVKSFFRYVLPAFPRCTYQILLYNRDDGLVIEWYAISPNFAANLIFFPTGRVKSLFGLIPYFRNFQTSHQPLNVHIR